MPYLCQNFLQIKERKYGKSKRPNCGTKLSEIAAKSSLRITDELPAPPVVLKIDESIIGTLGNFSASTGKAKSKKTFNICAMVASALTNGVVLNYKSEFPAGTQSAHRGKRPQNSVRKRAGQTRQVAPDCQWNKYIGLI